MIMTSEEFRLLNDTDESDGIIKMKLEALELMIRKYTNNNFQMRNFRTTANIKDGRFSFNGPQYFKVGDTVQVSNSSFNDALYTVTEANEHNFVVDKPVNNENYVLCTKVEYPADIKMGIINLMKWDKENRSKVGVQSETISRHSVTYFNMDGDNSSLGYPKSLTGFLKPYMKARF